MALHSCTVNLWTRQLSAPLKAKLVDMMSTLRRTALEMNSNSTVTELHGTLAELGSVHVAGSDKVAAVRAAIEAFSSDVLEAMDVARGHQLLAYAHCLLAEPLVTQIVQTGGRCVKARSPGCGGWPKTLTGGAIHADLFPDNTFFLDGKLSGVIDFYFACSDFLAYDIAVCLNAWCFERRGEFNLTKGRALISSYETVRRLEPRERAALPILARGAAMRFFLTRLVDLAATPEDALVKPHNPLDYAERLGFHRQAKSPEDYGA
jgi:homoserine kinase